MSKLLTIRAACADYGLPRSSLYRETEKPDSLIKIRKIGKSSRIARDDLDAWLAALPVVDREAA